MNQNQFDCRISEEDVQMLRALAHPLASTFSNGTNAAWNM